MADSTKSNISRRAASAAPDAELIRLGAALDEAWRHAQAAVETAGRSIGAPAYAEDCAACDAAHLACSTIADEIAAIAPKSIAGLRVQAHALRFCQQFQPFIGGEDGEANTTDWRLIDQIVAWLDPLPTATDQPPAAAV